MSRRSATTSVARLSSDVNRILFVRNLPWKITAEEMYDVFGRYGAIRQIRVGNSNETRGKAYVVYEDIFDAKQACEHLSGFNVGGRYLVVLYFQPTRAGRVDVAAMKGEIESLAAKVRANEEESLEEEEGGRRR
jgi:pre-mRNA branch site protein p14